MEQIAAFENSENPKEAIRRLVADAKKRRDALGVEEPMKKKSQVKTKTQKTLKIGKDEPEITVKVVKSGTKRSVSSKKAVSAAKSVKSRKTSAAKTVSAARKASLVKSVKSSGKKATTAKASIKQEKSAAKSLASAKSKAKSVKEQQPATPTPRKAAEPVTPEKKRQSKVQTKEELKSSSKKMADKEFKKFLE